MIVGTIADFKSNKNIYPHAIQKGLDFLGEINLHKLTPGKYEIEEKIFMLIQEYETKFKEEVNFEMHANYLDIQYIVSGEEKIGYSPVVKNLISDQLAEKDIAFYDDVFNETEFVLQPEMFAVFLPYEAHRPCCNAEGKKCVRKAVIKIHKDLL